MDSNILDTIRSRRSVRKFLPLPVEDSLIRDILEAGRWAPSGLNNQPWRFVVIRDKGTVNSLAECTKYGHIIRNAQLLIAVFLDRNAMYDYTKDTQACGAAIQNMLLAAHGLGLGAVWLGEILNKKEEVGHILKVPDSLELMAVVAIGYQAGDTDASSNRRELSEIAFLEQYGTQWKKD
ncbi:MAG TPA: nitroreductase [archaeon]|nr:nitroreductase [archaeon]